MPDGVADALAEIRRVRSEAAALYQACTADLTAHEAAFFRPTNAPLSPQLSELDQRLDHAVSRARALLYELDVVCDRFEALYQAP